MFGQRIRESLHFWWLYLGPLLLVTAPFSVATEAVQWVLGAAAHMDAGEPQFNLPALTAMALLKPLAEGAIMAQLMAIQNGQVASLQKCLAFAVRMAPVLYPIYALLAIGVGFGWMLLIVPGVWLYARCCLAPWLATFEQQPVLGSFRTSFARTQRDQATIFLCIFFLGSLVIMATTLVTGTLVTLAGEGHGVRLVAAVITGLLGAIINVLVFRFYVLSRPNTEPATPADHPHQG